MERKSFRASSRDFLGTVQASAGPVLLSKGM